jgi:hypothetical protein
MTLGTFTHYKTTFPSGHRLLPTPGSCVLENNHGGGGRSVDIVLIITIMIRHDILPRLLKDLVVNYLF